MRTPLLCWSAVTVAILILPCSCLTHQLMGGQQRSRCSRTHRVSRTNDNHDVANERLVKDSMQLCLSSRQDNVVEEERNRAISLSQTILNSLRRRTPTLSCSSPKPLNLETDFYDPTTGLHSEGVWHNCLAGIASLKLASVALDDKDENHLLAAIHIADSLWGHAWDGVSFQRRSWSGLWDHSSLKEGAKDPPEQANYYKQCAEHRCIQHGMALVFWAKLVQHLHRDNELHYRYESQYRLIMKRFLEQYWDDDKEKWSTISKDQGGGTLSRPSASAGIATTNVDQKQQSQVYYRAVDQAVSLLACLDMLHLDEESKDLKRIITSTCQRLWTEFGYGSDKPSSYLNMNRNRNLWHDGWVALALLSCAQQCPSCWPNNPTNRQKDTGRLLQRLQSCYGGDGDNAGTMWHWVTSQKDGHKGGNVRYCGDNALWYAITTSYQEWSFLDSTQFEESHESFWEFVHQLQSQDRDGLVSVADVYPQIRLHPNTELAALVLWPFSG